MYLESREILRKEFSDLIESSHHTLHKDDIMRAFDFCVKHHSGQFRKTGEEYFTHPLIVAKELFFANFDHICIISALLHDVIEDTSITKQDIEKEFSQEIATIVDGVSKFKAIINLSKDEMEYEDLKKFFFASIKDIRVLIVKLFDRLHNMRTISGHSNVEKQRKKAMETIDIYVPLAARIGLQKVKVELEDLSFHVLYPKERMEIISKMNEIMLQKPESLIFNIQNHLKILLEEQKITFDVSWRYKSSYSIWRKMKAKHQQISNISDIIGFRIITDTVESCYYILYIIHSQYQFVKGRFNDYISSPKENGYKSLHTVVLVDGQMIEIQIRTNQMHTEAEYGIASHLNYKHNFKIDNLYQDESYLSWVKEILFLTENSDLKSVKTTIKADLISIYSLHNEIFKTFIIQENSSVIDAILIINVQKAPYLESVFINNKLSDFNAILQDGDIIEFKFGDEIILSSEFEKFCNLDVSRAILRNLLS